METPNTSSADQPSWEAFRPQPSRKWAPSSTTAHHVAVENPAGGAAVASRAKPSAQSRGTSTPYSTRAARFVEVLILRGGLKLSGSSGSSGSRAAKVLICFAVSLEQVRNHLILRSGSSGSRGAGCCCAEPPEPLARR